MRNYERGMGKGDIVVKKDVYVYIARTPAEGWFASHPLLYVFYEFKQFQGREVSLHFKSEIKEILLLLVSPRRRFIY